MNSLCFFWAWQISLPPGTLLPIKIRDSQLLPANADHRDGAFEARCNFTVAGRAQERIFLSCDFRKHADSASAFLRASARSEDDFNIDLQGREK
jgi:hypothetical protein